MDLKVLPKVTTWKKATEIINNNFEDVGAGIDSSGNEYLLAKGLYKTLEDLKNSHPYPEIGSWAFIGDGFPAQIFRWDGINWVPDRWMGRPDSIDLIDYIESEPIEDPTLILY